MWLNKCGFCLDKEFIFFGRCRKRISYVPLFLNAHLLSSRSSTATLLPMTPYPITWTPYCSPKSLPVVSWQKRPHPLCHYPAQTAPPLRPPTLTAIAASCLRWDQSGVLTNYGARVLFSHCFTLFALISSYLVLVFCLSNSLSFSCVQLLWLFKSTLNAAVVFFNSRRYYAPLSSHRFLWRKTSTCTDHYFSFFLALGVAFQMPAVIAIR